MNELVPSPNAKESWVQVAHACNPSYSRDRDQEDCSLKPAGANSSARTYLKNTHYKTLGWWSGSR
jgi:hypothetical protein